MSIKSKILIASCLYLASAQAAPPPIFGSGLFGCDYKFLIFSDYVKSTNHSIEICKVKQGYTLTIGKYDDPFNTEIIYFKREDVKIEINKVIFSGKYAYTLELSRFGGGTLIMNDGTKEETIDVLDDNSFYILNNINKYADSKKQLENLLINRKE